MKALIHLQFLRPVRSLLFVMYCTFGAYWWAKGLLKNDKETAALMAFVAALSLLLGFFIAGAAHEPMHRPFALLLPDLRRRQQKVTLWGCVVAAGLVTGLGAWILPTVAPVAVFGLSLALVSLPCMESHRPLGRGLEGAAGCLIAFAGWWLFCTVVGAKLPVFMNAAPWVFLFGGAIAAAASLVCGFSRTSLRRRAETPYIALQTHFFSYLFRRGLATAWQQELAAYRNQLKQTKPMIGRDWSFGAVGSSAREWRRVFRHAAVGGRGTWFAFKGRVGSALLGVLLVMVFGYFWRATDGWNALARVAVLDFSMIKARNVGALILLMLFQPVAASLCALTLASPQLAYPISRHRIARVMYLQSVIQWGVALLVPAGALFLLSLLGQTMSGRYLPGYGLPALLAMDLVLAAVLPLLVVAGTFRQAGLRIIAAVPLVSVTTVAAFTRSHWSDALLTPEGIAGALAAACFTQWLLWGRLVRHYAKTDIVIAPDFATGMFSDVETQRSSGYRPA